MKKLLKVILCSIICYLCIVSYGSTKAENETENDTPAETTNTSTTTNTTETTTEDKILKNRTLQHLKMKIKKARNLLQQQDQL